MRSTGTAGMLASVEDDEEDMEEGGAGTPTLLLLSVSLRTVSLRVEGEQHVQISSTSVPLLCSLRNR